MFYDSRPVSDDHRYFTGPCCDCCFERRLDLDLTRFEWIESDRDLSFLPTDGGYLCADCLDALELVECDDIICDASIAALYASEGF